MTMIHNQQQRFEHLRHFSSKVSINTCIVTKYQHTLKLLYNYKNSLTNVFFSDTEFSSLEKACTLSHIMKYISYFI